MSNTDIEEVPRIAESITEQLLNIVWFFFLQFLWNSMSYSSIYFHKPTILSQNKNKNNRTKNN